MLCGGCARRCAEAQRWPAPASSTTSRCRFARARVHRAGDAALTAALPGGRLCLRPCRRRQHPLQPASSRPAMDAAISCASRRADRIVHDLVAGARRQHQRRARHRPAEARRAAAHKPAIELELMRTHQGSARSRQDHEPGQGDRTRGLHDLRTSRTARSDHDRFALERDRRHRRDRAPLPRLWPDCDCPDLRAVAVLDEAGRFAARRAGAAQSRSATAQGSRLENGVVRTPDGFRDAYRTVRRGRLERRCSSIPRYGGQGLPWRWRRRCQEMWSSANMALQPLPAADPGRDRAAAAHGSAGAEARPICASSSAASGPAR